MATLFLGGKMILFSMRFILWVRVFSESHTSQKLVILQIPYMLSRLLYIQK